MKATSRIQQFCQQSVRLRREWIYHRYPVARESVMHIFGEQQTATSGGRSGEYHGIPDAKTMTNRKINGRKQHRLRNLNHRERVLPVHQCSLSLVRCASSFSNQQVKQFSHDLCGKKGAGARQSGNQIPRSVGHGGTVYAFGVRQNICVECESQHLLVQLIAVPTTYVQNSLRTKAP
jgi:hypothetical protein